MFLRPVTGVDVTPHLSRVCACTTCGDGRAPSRTGSVTKGRKKCVRTLMVPASTWAPTAGNEECVDGAQLIQDGEGIDPEEGISEEVETGDSLPASNTEHY